MPKHEPLYSYWHILNTDVLLRGSLEDRLVYTVFWRKRAAVSFDLPPPRWCMEYNPEEERMLAELHRQEMLEDFEELRLEAERKGLPASTNFLVLSDLARPPSEAVEKALNPRHESQDEHVEGEDDNLHWLDPPVIEVSDDEDLL